MGGLRFAFFDPTEAMKMSLLGKRISVYFLCFSILMLPYHKANAIGWGAAAVILDVITIAWPDGDDIKTGGICANRKFASNDPIWKCEGRTSKSNWLGKAKGSARWGALFALAGFWVADSSIKKDSSLSGGWCGPQPNRMLYADCVALFKETFPSTRFPGQRVLKFFVGSDGYPRLQVYWVNNNTNTYEHTWKYTPGSVQTVEDEQFKEEFWQTSPIIPPETWLPEPTPEVPSPVHPEPDWFPETKPVSPPYVPAPDVTPTYPYPLPDTHPDHRPEGEPAPVPQPGDFPSVDPVKNPDYWPPEVPSPGEYPVEWPLPGHVPVFDPVTNPDPENPDTGTGTNPDTGELPVPLPVVGPLTLSQLQTNQSSQWQNAANSLNLPTFEGPQQQITEAMTEFLDNKVSQEIPAFEFNPFGYFNFGGGSCIPIEVSPTIGGKSMGTIQLKEHCQPMQEYVRPTLEWALYLSTGLYLYMLFTRTVRSL